MKRKIRIGLSALFLSAIATSAFTTVALGQAEPKLHSITHIHQPIIATATEEAQIRELTRRWFAAWSPKDKPFTGRGLENVFATGDNAILVFDNFNGGVVVIHSLKEYLDTWVPIMQSTFAYWEIQPEGSIDVKVNGDLAVSTFTWVSNARLKDGKPTRTRQHGTHVWQRINGQWRLVHEHLTVGNPPAK